MCNKTDCEDIKKLIATKYQELVILAKSFKEHDCFDQIEYDVSDIIIALIIDETLLVRALNKKI